MKKMDGIMFTAFCGLSFYSFGTALMDYFLVYPSRAIVGESEFVAYHALLEKAILPISVFPFLLITVLNIILLFRTLPAVPKALLWGSLFCLILDWISSIFIQIPMNLLLNEGKDSILIQQVMDSNWGRVIFETSQVVLVFIMMNSALLIKTVPSNILEKAAYR